MSRDKHMYGKLIEEKFNAYLRGNNIYPKTLMNSYHFVSRWINDPRNRMNVIGTSNDGLKFAHNAAPIPCSNRKTVTCFNCQEIGHLKHECPNCQSSAHTATSAPSKVDKVPVARGTGITGFNNLNIGHHSDFDAESNLECSFLVNNDSIPSLGSFLTSNPLLMYCTTPNC